MHAATHAAHYAVALQVQCRDLPAPAHTEVQPGYLWQTKLLLAIINFPGLVMQATSGNVLLSLQTEGPLL